MSDLNVKQYEKEAWLRTIWKGHKCAYEITSQVQKDYPRFSYRGMAGKDYCENLMQELSRDGLIKFDFHFGGLFVTVLGRDTMRRFQ